MATLDYSKRLSNLQQRKFDPSFNESTLSKGFSHFEGLPENVKYLVESMQPIEEKYNARTLEAAENVQKHLEEKLQLHFARDYRTQGSTMTRTNIKVYSDIDLLTAIERYFFPGPGATGFPYNASDPNQDINDLRAQSISILRKKYDKVDDTHEKCVSIFNKSLHRKVDIVFCHWYHTQSFQSNGSEYYRGVKFPIADVPIDFPFATIQQVNIKGNTTNDGSRKAIRLLKTLKADSDEGIEITSFQLTSIVHAIENDELYYQREGELKIARAVSDKLGHLLENPAYRKSVESPNGEEKPLSADRLVPELEKLKADLDILIVDAAKEISASEWIRKAVINY